METNENLKPGEKNEATEPKVAKNAPISGRAKAVNAPAEAVKLTYAERIEQGFDTLINLIAQNESRLRNLNRGYRHLFFTRQKLEQLKHNFKRAQR